MSHKSREDNTPNKYLHGQAKNLEHLDQMEGTGLVKNLECYPLKLCVSVCNSTLVI
jgi:hypothetical protein